MSALLTLTSHRSYTVQLSADHVAELLNDAGGPHGDHFVALPLDPNQHAEPFVWVNAWQVVEVIER